MTKAQADKQKRAWVPPVRIECRSRFVFDRAFRHGLTEQQCVYDGVLRIPGRLIRERNRVEAMESVEELIQRLRRHHYHLIDLLVAEAEKNTAEARRTQRTQR